MAHTNRVLQSINLPGDTICVDIFIRPNGTYGFDEFRRDPEDGRGWFSIGHHGSAEFGSVKETAAAAIESISWLKNLYPQWDSTEKLLKNFKF